MKKQDILSLLLSATAFAVFLVLHWNFLIAAVLSVGLYVAFGYLFRSRRKIGGVDIESLQNGEKIEITLEEAKKDLEAIRSCWKKASSVQIRNGAEHLVKTGGDILHYLEEHVEKMPEARKFLNYYLDTGAGILTKYTKLRENGLPDGEMAQVEKKRPSLPSGPLMRRLRSSMRGFFRERSSISRRISGSFPAWQRPTMLMIF